LIDFSEKLSCALSISDTGGQMKKIISTLKAPGAVGPYSQGVLAGGFLYVSGQLPLDPETGKMVEGSTQDLTRRCMDNLSAVVSEAGGTIENLVKVNIYTTNMGLFADMNKAYSSYFTDEPPARAVVEVSSLPLGATIEIEGVAYLGNS
jgi:2-iminobutanoate/2-iminopropanoate deaminase